MAPTIKPYITTTAAHFVDLGHLTNGPRQWNRTLTVIKTVSSSITDDIFLAVDTAAERHEKISNSDEALQFVQSCLYYREAFLRGPFNHAKPLLRPYFGQAKDEHNKSLTMGEFIAEVEIALDKLDKAIEFLRESATQDSWGTRVPIPTIGSRVPTASPSQLLYELLLKRIPHNVGQEQFLTPFASSSQPSFSEQHHIQYVPKQAVALKVRHGTLIVLRNQLVSLSIQLVIVNTSLRVGKPSTFRVTASFPSLLEALCDLECCVLMREVMFYYVHHALHTPFLYKHIHNLQDAPQIHGADELGESVSASSGASAGKQLACGGSKSYPDHVAVVESGVVGDLYGA